MLDTAHSDGVATLTLARPERGNALSVPLVEALIAAIETACGDNDLHTLVLRSHGPHFCTGFDLSDLADASDADLLHRFVRIETMLSALWRAPIRTMAHASGRTWGAGADLFAACDVRAAADDTTFRFPGARFGLVLGTRRLAERVGTDVARRCVIDGSTLDLASAERAGLVTDRVAASSDAWSGWLAQRNAPVADRQTLAMLHAATRPDHSDADLAALVRSAARPGLKQRIERYVALTKKR